MMQTHHNPVRRQTDRVNSLLEKPDLDPEVFKAVLDQLSTVRPHLAYFERRDGYKRFLLNFVSQYDETACGCSAYMCALKQGNLPPKIREQAARDIDGALDTYVAEHDSPYVLIEAREAWDNLVSRIQEALDECAAACRQNDATLLTHLPEDEDEEDES